MFAWNQIPATVSLQVVIGLCRRKETAALKTKAAMRQSTLYRIEWKVTLFLLQERP